MAWWKVGFVSWGCDPVLDLADDGAAGLCDGVV